MNSEEQHDAPGLGLERSGLSAHTIEA